MRLLLASVALATFVAACASGGEEARTTGGSQTPAPTFSPTPTQPAQDRIRLVINETTEYYAASGGTTAVIFESIKRNGLGSAEGDHASGLTATSLGLEWRNSGVLSICSIESMTITLEIVVTLPGVLRFADRDLQRRWVQFTGEVAEHEQAHVDIFKDGAEETRRQMIALTSLLHGCPDLEREVERIWSDQQVLTARRQDDFHREENSRLASRRRPLETQINVNQARIEEIQRQIDSADRDLASIDSQLDQTTAEMEAIERRFPTLVLPEPYYSRYGVLQTHRTSLATQYNALVAYRNALVGESNEFVDSTAELVDELNWVQ